MNRRKVLQGLAALPLASTLAGCKEQPAKGTLKIILHGPFAVVVVRRNNAYRVNAFVPSVPAGVKMTHEFRFPTPMDFVANESQGKRFSFELSDKGLEVFDDRPPYLDHGFDDFNLGHIGEWKPQPDKYFVFLDLPAPEVITYFVPAEGVLLKDGRTATMPIEHILEYRMRDTGQIRLGDKPPLTCSQLVEEFHKHWQSSEHREEGPPSQRPYMDAELGHCSNDVAAYFLGVGLSEKKYTDQELQAHAVDFFNDVLLPSLVRTAERKPAISRFQLEQVLGYGAPCKVPPGAQNLPTLSPAVYQDWLPEPRLRTVSSVEDCKLGGISGFSP